MLELEFDYNYLFQNFNYEIQKELLDFFTDPKERWIIREIYANDLEIAVLEEFISGKFASEPIKHPRYGLISNPKHKLEFVNDLKLQASAMRNRLIEIHEEVLSQKLEEEEQIIALKKIVEN